LLWALYVAKFSLTLYNPLMAAVRPIRPPSPEPVGLHTEAMDNLRFIRHAMENAGSFTAVPGVGGMLMGATALFAAFAAHLSKSPRAWLAIWSGEALMALIIGLGFSYRKAMRNNTPLLSRPFRRFVLAMVPAVYVGALVTYMLYRAGAPQLMPPVWLLLYGVGVSSGGAFSVRVVPIMGVLFLGIGTVAAIAPSAWADPLMALGFGGLHLVFGFVIARFYGG
jgi:hypothetical protein